MLRFLSPSAAYKCILNGSASRPEFGADERDAQRH